MGTREGCLGSAGFTEPVASCQVEEGKIEVKSRVCELSQVLELSRLSRT